MNITCCENPDPHTLDSRGQSEWRRRRYECRNCKKRFTTVEVIVYEGSCADMARKLSVIPVDAAELKSEILQVLTKY